MKIKIKTGIPGPNSIKFILSGLFKFSQKLTNQIAIISEKTFEMFGAVTKSPFFPNGFFF